MAKYDPSMAPEPSQWLSLDEQERLSLVMEYHHSAGIVLPNDRIHASIHVIVENQIAEGHQPTVTAIARLMGEELSRHDALHAIGSVVAEHIYNSVNSVDPNYGQKAQALFDAAVEGLTTERWEEMAGDADVYTMEELLEELDFWTGRSKRTLVYQAIDHKEEITPHLLSHLERVIEDPEGYLQEDHDLLPYALLLLALFREERSHSLMLSLFRLPGERLDHLMGSDLRTAALPLLLLRTCGGSVQTIKQLVLDRNCDDFVRWAAMEALANAVAAGMADREETIRFLAALLTGEEAERGSFFWTGVLHVLCDLYPSDVMGEIRTAYEKGLVVPRTINIDEFQETLDLGLDWTLEKMRDELSWRLPEDLDDMLNMFEGGEEAPGRAAVENRRKDKETKKKRKAKKKLAKKSRRRNR